MTTIESNLALSSNTEQTKSQISRDSLNTTFKDFVTLFITQLKHQDPLSPFDSNQLTDSLANLSQVGESINTNAHLEELIALQKQSLNGGFSGAQVNDAVAYIEREVNFISSDIDLNNSEAVFSYDVDDSYDSITIAIKDKSGETVFLGSGDAREGKHPVLWDGQDNNAAQLADGIYTVLVTGYKAESDTTTALQTSTGGVVSGALIDQGEVILEVGRNRTAIDAITSVRSTNL